MNKTIKLVSPVDGRLVAERSLPDEREIAATLTRSSQAQAEWENTAIKERAKICHSAIDKLREKTDEIATEITLQMGRPISFSAGELSGLEERGRYMIDIAGAALGNIEIEKGNQYTRLIKKQPHGSVVTIAPWNYPYLTAINTVFPALMAGNSLILKHSAQTLLCAERLFEAFSAAGLPPGVFQYLHLDHEQTCRLVKDPRTDYISFTGSVPGGVEIEQCLAATFKGLALELGGKDPGYVRADANLEYAVAQLVDGAFFNSGQSCCAIERIYVHASIYDEFLSGYIAEVENYRLGNPLDSNTSLGPVINYKAATRIRQHINDAISKGARTCINEKLFDVAEADSHYLAPQVLTGVDHEMKLMTEETFGPVIGIMKVASDEEAISLMNDSKYGLTASIWTEDMHIAEEIGDKINCGTVFMNRCDYLDPALAWSGINQSGRGCSLSILGYEQLTRPKSFHLKNR